VCLIESKRFRCLPTQRTHLRQIFAPAPIPKLLPDCVDGVSLQSISAIIDQANAAQDYGAVGALLRRKCLYFSRWTTWIVGAEALIYSDVLRRMLKKPPPWDGLFSSSMVTNTKVP
jgi:hypothetical protein